MMIEISENAITRSSSVAERELSGNRVVAKRPSGAWVMKAPVAHEAHRMQAAHHHLIHQQLDTFVLVAQAFCCTHAKRLSWKDRRRLIHDIDTVWEVITIQKS